MKLLRFSYLTGYILYYIWPSKHTFGSRINIFKRLCNLCLWTRVSLFDTDLIGFPQMNWLVKTSKPIKKGGRIFWKCVVLIKKYIQWPLKSKPSTDNSFWPAIFAQADFYIRGHLQTMWTVFWVFLTPPSPLVDKHGHFGNPPPCPCGFFNDPPPLALFPKKFSNYQFIAILKSKHTSYLWNI